MSIRGVLFQ